VDPAVGLNVRVPVGLRSGLRTDDREFPTAWHQNHATTVYLFQRTINAVPIALLSVME
jgi:hypothetical protein